MIFIPHPDNPWQLFNLEKDRKEANAVAQYHPEILQQLDDIVKGEHSKSHVKKWNFLNKVYSMAAFTGQQVKL